MHWKKSDLFAESRLTGVALCCHEASNDVASVAPDILRLMWVEYQLLPTLLPRRLYGEEFHVWSLPLDLMACVLHWNAGCCYCHSFSYLNYMDNLSAQLNYVLQYLFDGHICNTENPKLSECRMNFYPANKFCLTSRHRYIVREWCRYVSKDTFTDCAFTEGVV